MQWIKVVTVVVVGSASSSGVARMAKSNFDEEIKSSITATPKHTPKPPGKAAAHNPDTIPPPPPSPHEFTDSTAQDGLEVPSPVGTEPVAADGFLPSDPTAMGATGPDSGSDPMLMEAIAMILQTLMARPEQMEAPIA